MKKDDIVEYGKNTINKNSYQLTEQSGLDLSSNKKQKINTPSNITTSQTLSLFKLILIILIIFTLIRVLYNGSGDIVSFGSLLEILRDAPQVSMSVKNFVMQIGFKEPWSVLDSFRIIINSFINMWSILVWISAGLVDLIFFITYFLMWLFV